MAVKIAFKYYPDANMTIIFREEGDVKVGFVAYKEITDAMDITMGDVKTIEEAKDFVAYQLAYDFLLEHAMIGIM